jgi:predicted AlkP superfamily pyrophosphatase or phosphodiesterase
MKKFTLLFPLISLLLSFSCNDNNESFESAQKVAEKYQTKNVVLLVVDGPRISETWEAANKENIPNRVNLLQQGVFISDFKNNGTTNTNPGHSAMCSGVYESIQNNGKRAAGLSVSNATVAEVYPERTESKPGLLHLKTSLKC